MVWAISGTGLVSSLGDRVDSSFAAFCRGESGNALLRAFDRSKYRAQRAYEIADRPDGVDVPGRATRWLCDAIGQAVEQSGIAVDERVAVVVGTGLQELRSLELWAVGRAPCALDDLHFGSAVRRTLGAAPTVGFTNACSASLFALAHATDLLTLGEADAVVVAGTDSITESMFGLLDRVNMEPPDDVRPFDQDRRGVLLGEGAAAVVLEPVDRVEANGRQPLALLRGVGTGCDAYHVTAPHQEGIVRTLRDAHARARVEPHDIDVVFVHGTGTLLNDETEASAIREVFGEAVSQPVFTALKSLIGHTSGASGLMSLVVAVESLRTGRVPPTIGQDKVIAEAERFRFVSGAAYEGELRLAQVDAFGFGGVNAVAILERS